MGVVKYSALVSDISGKVGGNIFSRNGSGSYVKTFKKPINPNTTKQQTVRAQMATLVASWKSLTPAQQQLWIDIAPQYPYQNRMGESSTYTGQQLYIKLNMNLQVVGATLLTTPKVPAVFSNTQVTTLEMPLVLGVLTGAEIDFSNDATAGESVIISITTSLSNGIISPSDSAFKQLQIVTDGSAISPTDITTAYQALYGDPQLGTKIFARADLVLEATGQRLHIGQASTTVSGT